MSVEIGRSRIALGIRQPWVELILRGCKTIEVRSQPTNIRGTIFIYAARKHATSPDANTACVAHNLNIDDLPTGLIVGQVDIVDVRAATPVDTDAACVSSALLENQYAWTLANPVRYETPLRPRFLPYGVWFYPFRRRGEQ